MQADVAAVLRTQGAARAAATTKLNSDLKVLDAQRAYLDKIMMAAIAATGASGRPPCRLTRSAEADVLQAPW